MSEIEIRVEKIYSDACLPSYATDGSVGMDLYAHTGDKKSIIIPSAFDVNGKVGVLISTGIKIALPDLHEAQIRPRSGLAVKHGITVINSPGTIDSDYRGEIKVALINLHHNPFTIEHGMRIAQMVISPIVRATLTVTEIDETSRGEGGFGSTGQF